MGSHYNLSQRLKLLILRIACLLAIVTFGACSHKTTTIPEVLPVENQLQKYIPVIVTDYRSLDGCEFLLELANGEKLQPINLADSLKIDKLKIRILYIKQKGMGICMAGEMVRLTDVKK